MARGDHVRVKRTGYWHHGIDCGDGTVVHFAGTASEKRNAVVVRTIMADFAKGGVVEVVRHRKPDDPDTVVRRAVSRLGDTRYHLLRNNCEHFARWCVSGHSRSRQVQQACVAAGGVFLTVGGTALTVAARHIIRRRLGLARRASRT